MKRINGPGDLGIDGFLASFGKHKIPSNCAPVKTPFPQKEVRFLRFIFGKPCIQKMKYELPSRLNRYFRVTVKNYSLLKPARQALPRELKIGLSDK